MARKISLATAVTATAKAVSKAGKVRPPKAAAKAAAKVAKAAVDAPKAAPMPATSSLQSGFAVKFAKAFCKAHGKAIASLSAGMSVPTAKLVDAGVSLQSLAHMAHKPGVKAWSQQPSLDLKALDAGKVQFTAHGAARYADAFKAIK